jgi:hypothetical protein
LGRVWFKVNGVVFIEDGSLRVDFEVGVAWFGIFFWEFLKWEVSGIWNLSY